MSLKAPVGAARAAETVTRVRWVAGLCSVFVLLVHIPVPGINLTVWKSLLEHHGSDLINFLGMFTGGALNKFSIGAMGITPYINASIIMQLLSQIWPWLHDLQKEGGEQGRRQVAQYTRYGTMALALMQSWMMTLALSKVGVFYRSSWDQYLLTVVSLTAGTAFLMWLSDQISEKGIGNGTSLIIFSGIVLSYPRYISSCFRKAQLAGPMYWLNLALFFIVFVVLIAAVVALTLGERRVPVQYAKRQVGRRVYGGQSTFIPVRINNAGVISIIFAISIMYLPATIVRWFVARPEGLLEKVLGMLTPQHWVFNLAYAALVMFFTYFYASIQFNPIDVADTMKKNGGFIPGIRPGRPTAEFLDKVLLRLTFIAASALALIAVLPTYVVKFTGVDFALGSTSLLIIVGVALDVMSQYEARLKLRNYEGFVK